ncbi:MAG: hypothetical protein KGM99_12290 [Burkholderiales bacterium]|nr:hypothetical protein [Burkholderiales bacterium]
MDYIKVIKENPIPIALGVGVLLLIMMRGGSSNAAIQNGYNPAVALQSQAIAANTDVQINGQNAQVTMANMQLQQKLSETRAAYASNVFQASTAASVAMNQTQGVNTANFLQHLDNQNAVAANLNMGMANTMAGQSVAFAGLKNNLDMLNVNANTQLSLAGIQANTQRYGMDTGKQVALAQLNSASQITNKSLDYKYAIDNRTIDSNNANLPSLLQFSANAMQIQNAGAQQLAVINGQNTQALATISADTLRYQTNAAMLKAGLSGGGGGGGGGLFGGILGGIGGAIGDAIGGLFGGGAAADVASAAVWV